LLEYDASEAVRSFVERTVSQRACWGYNGDPVRGLRNPGFNQFMDREAFSLRGHVDPLPERMKTSGSDCSLLMRKLRQDPILSWRPLSSACSASIRQTDLEPVGVHSDLAVFLARSKIVSDVRVHPGFFAIPAPTPFVVEGYVQRGVVVIAAEFAMALLVAAVNQVTVP
jgi:hypothetical protein